MEGRGGGGISLMEGRGRYQFDGGEGEVSV